MRHAGMIVLVVAALQIVGCGVKYVTPGAGVNLDAISDTGIKQRFETKPASPFPARIVVARVQQPGYYSHGNRGYGQGTYSVVTTRDIEQDEQIDKLAALPQVAGLGTLNRLLLPQTLQTVKDLRLAAATLHADLLLIYTLDTSFRVKEQDVGPLGVITLGFLPNRKAFVTTTASAVIYDVRTGHVYGLAEASHTTGQIASLWSTEAAIDNTRLETEKAAFGKLVDQLCETWSGILEEYAGGAADAAAGGQG